VLSEPTLTVAGLRELIEDLRRAGRVPRAIVLSAHDKNSIKDELEGDGQKHKVDDREKDPTLDEVVAIILGVPILSHPEISRGRARIIENQGQHLNG